MQVGGTPLEDVGGNAVERDIKGGGDGNASFSPTGLGSPPPKHSRKEVHKKATTLWGKEK